MRAACQEPALHERKCARAFYEPVLRNGGLCAGLGAVFDIDLIFSRVLEQIILQSAARLLGLALHGAEIIFLYLPVAYLVV